VININNIAKHSSNLQDIYTSIVFSSSSSKMIEQCLQKNPVDRPTAKQLLKHDFFKKAKDRSYIAKHLALKFQDRKKMEEKTVNRRKPASIRAVRLSDSGEWKFSSGSDDESTGGNDTASGEDAANKLKQLENQTIKNMGDLIEKNDIATKSVQKQISVLFI
jgi:serine/threonine-protein kinase OSR1/STK39